MRAKCLVCLLLVSLTYGQAPTPMTPAAGAKPEQNAPAAPGQAPTSDKSSRSEGARSWPKRYRDYH